MGIPVPGRGYWARVQSGQVPLRAKLPKIKAGQKAVVNLNKRGHILEETKELQDEPPRVLRRPVSLSQAAMFSALFTVFGLC